MNVFLTGATGFIGQSLVRSVSLEQSLRDKMGELRLMAGAGA